MNRTSAFAGLLLAGLLACGCANESDGTRTEAGEATAPALPAPDATPAAVPTTQASVAKAREVLAEVGRQYREAPTLTDEVTLIFQGQPQTMTMRFDRDDARVSMELPTAAAIAVDGKLYMTTEVMYDLFYERTLDGMDVGSAISELGWVPPYHFAMRKGDDVDSYLSGLGLGILRNPRIRGYDEVTDEDDGMTYHVITLDASQGSALVLVDAQRMVITRILMELLPGPNQPANAPRTQTLVEANPMFADELAEPIIFDRGDRRAVHEADAMTPRPLLTGDMAPDFTLQTLDGETVRLSDLRGQVVALDFWATWCVPCIMAMPHFDRFARWAMEEDRPVKVFAVNTMEQAPTPAQRLTLAQNFWNERDFAVPVLFDADNLVIKRYGYVSIPMTIVIGPDGRITKTHDQFSRNMFQILKTAAERALQEANSHSSE